MYGVVDPALEPREGTEDGLLRGGEEASRVVGEGSLGLFEGLLDESVIGVVGEGVNLVCGVLDLC